MRDWLVQGICIIIGLFFIFALCIAAAELDTSRMQARQHAAQAEQGLLLCVVFGRESISDC